MKKETWYVYIVECIDGKLYTGISNDVKSRVAAHNKGKGCKFTRSRYPVMLVYRRKCGAKSAALKREMQVKSFSRCKKLELIKCQN